MERKQFTPGIYLEVKTVGVNANDLGRAVMGLAEAQHAYLVYRKADGTTEVLRGGPRHNIGSDLLVETGKSLEESEDRYASHEKPGSRPSQRLNIDPKKLDETWKRMGDHAKRIHAAEITYLWKPEGKGEPWIEQNSNSVVRSVLETVDIPIEDAIPKGISKDDMPGIRDNLMTHIWRSEELKKLHSSPIGLGEKARRVQEIEAKFKEWNDDFKERAKQETDEKPRPPSKEEQEDFGTPNYPEAGNFGTKDTGPNAKTEDRPSVLNDFVSGAVIDKSGALGDDTEAQQSKLVEDLSKVDDPVADLLYKRSADLTAEELKKVQDRAADEKDRDRANQFHDHAMGNFEHRFGTEPVKHDEVGKMIQPQEINPHPKTAQPAKTKDG